MSTLPDIIALALRVLAGCLYAACILAVVILVLFFPLALFIWLGWSLWIGVPLQIFWWWIWEDRVSIKAFSKD